MDVAVDGDQVPSTPPSGADPSHVDLVTPRQPSRLDLHPPVLLKGLVVHFPSRRRAHPQLAQLVVYVPEMNNSPPPQ